MTKVTAKLLGGLQTPQGGHSLDVALPEGSTVRDLDRRLAALGFDPGSLTIVVTLNGRGLRQWPCDHPVAGGDDVAIFPRITGG